MNGPNKHLVVNLCTAINDYTAVYTQAVKVGNIFVKILDPVFGDLAKFYLAKFKESGASVKREAHCHQHRGCKTLCKETSSGRKKRGVGTDTARKHGAVPPRMLASTYSVPTFSPRQIRDGGGMGVPHTMYR